jgi:hypothetical protein
MWKHKKIKRKVFLLKYRNLFRFFLLSIKKNKVVELLSITKDSIEMCLKCM